MSSHRTLRDLNNADFRIPDPGDGLTIDMKGTFLGVVEIVTTGAETRTLAQPTKLGQAVGICMKTDGGDLTLTVTGGFNNAGDTSLTMDDAGDYIEFRSINSGGSYYWRIRGVEGVGGIAEEVGSLDLNGEELILDADGDTSITADTDDQIDVKISNADDFQFTANTFTALSGSTIKTNTIAETTAGSGVTIDGNILHDMATTAGTGITTGADNFASKVEKVGTLFKTTIVIDVDGLNSGGNANDVIGKADTANCSLGQITAARNGTIFAGTMTCIETPAGGDDDIDLWDAESGTLTEDTDIEDDAGAEDQLTNGGDLTAGTVVPLTAYPTADRYLYLGAGTGDTNDTYTAGILVIELWGK